MCIFEYKWPIKARLQYLGRCSLSIEMAPTLYRVAVFQYLTHFTFRHTPSNNMIDTLLKEDWVFPEIVFYFCKESILLLKCEVRWNNTDIDNWLCWQTMGMFQHVTKLMYAHLGMCHQSSNDVFALFLAFPVLTDDRLPYFWNPSYLESPHQVFDGGMIYEHNNFVSYKIRSEFVKGKHNN